MDATPLQMSDTVRFEIPAHADVDALSDRIHARWPGSTRQIADDVWLVTARVRKSKDDLALLLREAEAIIAETGLQAIRYHVDGRAYVLAGQTDIGYLWGIANDVAWQLDAV